MRLQSLALCGSVLVSGSTLANTIGYMELEGGVVERQMASSLFGSSGDMMTLRDVTATLDDAAGADLDGLVIRLRDFAFTRAQIEEVGRAMQRVRDAGTPIHVFTEIYGPGELLFAAHADEVLIQSGGALSFPGMYMQEMFLADALRSVGVEPDYVQVGDFKGASEMMANTKPSDAWDKNINQLMDSMYGNMTDAIGEGRGLSKSDLEAAMADCILATPETAMEHGLVDAAIDRLDLNAYLEETYGEFDWDRSFDPSPDADVPDFANMSFFETLGAIMEMLAEEPGSKTSGDTIAVVHIDGAIVDGDSSSGSLLGGSTVGSRTLRKTLRDIERDDHIKGVIVRINSPGGSAIASESIWLGVRRVAEEKPVWVSVGDMAASGGYYIAVAGDKIYVNDNSVVGSIGVVGGKLAMRGLYEKFQINVVGRSRGPNAHMMSTLDPWTPGEQTLIRDKMTEVYDQFVDRVTNGRDGIDISRTAEGRLFTGDKALRLKMADEIGGIDDAINDMAASLELSEFDVLDYPGPMTFEEMLNGMMPFATAQTGTSGHIRDLSLLLREVVGSKDWPAVRDNLNALLQMRDERVLLVSPRALILP